MKIMTNKTIFKGVSSFTSKEGKDLYKLTVADVELNEKTNREKESNPVSFFITKDLYYKCEDFREDEDYIELALGLTQKNFQYRVYVNDIKLVY